MIFNSYFLQSEIPYNCPELHSVFDPSLRARRQQSSSSRRRAPRNRRGRYFTIRDRRRSTVKTERVLQVEHQTPGYQKTVKTCLSLRTFSTPLPQRVSRRCLGVSSILLRTTTITSPIILAHDAYAISEVLW